MHQLIQWFSTCQSTRGRNPQETAHYWAKSNTKFLFPNTVSLKLFCEIAIVLKETNTVESKLLGFSILRGNITFVSKVKMEVKMTLNSKKSRNQPPSPQVDWKIYSLPKVSQGFYFRKLILKSGFDDDNSNNNNRNNSSSSSHEAQTFTFRDDHWE